MNVLFWVAVSLAVVTFMFAAPLSVGFIIAAFAIAGIAYRKESA